MSIYLDTDKQWACKIIVAVCRLWLQIFAELATASSSGFYYQTECGCNHKDCDHLSVNGVIPKKTITYLEIALAKLGP